LKTRQLERTVAAWYRENKREMPWRGELDPYRIWLSEVILQQTRVAQGAPYYLHFIASYPSVKDLADASEDKVLKSWEGLGYYSRARNLHKASKIVAHELKGEFPQDYKGLLTLPGIGPYTAAAIASICYEERVAVIDGNVNRVVARSHGILEAVDSKAGGSAIQALVQRGVLSADSASEFNQAMMEFGALQCVPKNPNCDICPLINDCYAYRKNKVSELPIKNAKTKVRERYINYYVITDAGHTYVRQRKEKGIWQGLFEFAAVEYSAADIANQAAGQHPSETISRYVHVLSHQRIHACFIVCGPSEAPLELSVYERIELTTLSEIPMARIHTRFLEEHGHPE
jgi:A/G-specific adenine glycosylase